ncbi:ANK1 [Linum perenne]
MAPDASDALVAREKVKNLLGAALSGNLDLLKLFAAELDEGQGIAKTVAAIKDAKQRGALHFAAREGKTEVCKFLVDELKLDVNAKDEDGETPLLHAARQGHNDTAKYLLERGAKPAIPSDLGATALHHCAGEGNTELMKYLLSKGMQVDFDSDAGTPLVWAAGHGQKDALKVLLEHHANPNAETEDGITPLLSAVAANSSECTELLVQAGASAKVMAGGATPLHIAADHGNMEILKCLLEAGADPNMADEDGLKAIQVAASRGNHAAVEILLPKTSKIETIPEWTVDGIIRHVQSETDSQEELSRNVSEVNLSQEAKLPRKDLPEVSPEAKEKSAEAKSRGDEAFRRKDYRTAIDAYSQAIDFDPTNGNLFSNRSLCWVLLGVGEPALRDARDCIALKPDWAKAWYREGAALRLLKASALFFPYPSMNRFEEAANAFFKGVQLDPDSVELGLAFKEAVDAGREFHRKEKGNSS